MISFFRLEPTPACLLPGLGASLERVSHRLARLWRCPPPAPSIQQLLAFALALVSFIYILAENDEVRTDKARRHRAMGVATMALAIVQVVLGASRNQISQHGQRDPKDPDDHVPRCVACPCVPTLYPLASPARGCALLLRTGPVPRQSLIPPFGPAAGDGCSACSTGPAAFRCC